MRRHFLHRVKVGGGVGGGTVSNANYKVEIEILKEYPSIELHRQIACSSSVTLFSSFKVK